VLRFITRREWLRIGGLGGLGLALPPVQARSRAELPGFGKAKSVLIIHASGGQSQIDTWDPKPDAPAEVRGEFRPIHTSVPGTLFCEHLPRVARLAHLVTVVRNVSHDDLDHGSATYLTLTGSFHSRKSSNPPPRPTDSPALGAILQRVRPVTGLPASAAHVNGPVLVPEAAAPGQSGGFLGRACDPLVVSDPLGSSAATLAGLAPAPDLPAVRVEGRRTLLEALERSSRGLAGNPAALAASTLRRQAHDLLAAQRFRTAFDLSREPAALRERYGWYRSGQACLLGRRLVEAGVPLVTVFFNHTIRGQDKTPNETESYGWDTHNDIFEALRTHLLPRFDQTFSTLLLDLEQRGLLDSTLVVCMGEFGRAPLVAVERNFVGRSPGRKHWAAVYSIVLAGAGVSRGKLLGRSDRHGAYPATPPVGPPDVAATIFTALGIDPTGNYRDPLDRPYRISEGRPIRGLYEG
jgi:hypothetical protein